jgi:septum site-determining protein MinC
MLSENHAGGAFELKGRMATLTVLQVLTADIDELLKQLDGRLSQAPGFFTGMPLVIAPSASVALDAAGLQRLVDGLRARELVPVAAVDMPAEQAASAGLGWLRNFERPADGSATERGKSKSPAASTTRIVTTPVRSGQQIYAHGGDLVVTAPVSAGAELMADGHIHVYANLRGRALAGVQGDGNARIFCQSLNAELVAIAGHYQLSEQMDRGLQGGPVVIQLQGADLQLNAL